MPLSANDLVTQGNKRIFRQPGGPRPNNALRYAGTDDQYLSITGVASPVTGGITSINVPDPNRPKQYRKAGRTVDPADYPTATITVMERKGAIPFHLSDLTCPTNYYIVVGTCKDLSDFISGWDQWVEIYSAVEVNDNDLGDRTAFDSDEAGQAALSATLEAVYAIGPMSFGEKAAAAIDREVVGVTYGTMIQCGDCGPANDGTKVLYAVSKPSGAGSPGLPAEIHYSVDAGSAFTQANIDGFGANEEPLAIKVVGTRLVVLGADAYYWADINSGTGVPGAFTKVTTGFVGAGTPADMYVASPREIYFVGEAGYIYKSTDITSGVSVLSAGDATTNNLLRITGAPDGTLVATGADSVVLKSINRGISWGTTTTEPYGISLDVSAVAIHDVNRWWVGSAASGRLAYTLNGGESWTERNFSGNGSGTIRDIVIATEEVIHFSHDTNTPQARIFTTWNGGADFTNTTPRIQNFPIFDRATRLAVPFGAHATIAANNLAIAGLGGNGTDGILLIGAAATR